MNNQKYWEKRSELVLIQAEKAAAIVEAEMIQAYAAALDAVQKEMLAFYARTFVGDAPIRHVDAVKGNRLNALQRQIGDQLRDLGDVEQRKMTTLLEKAFKDAYTMTLFNVQQFTGVGASFLLPQPERVKEILNYPWSGAKFSDRIWRDKEKLAVTLQDTLNQGFVRGLGANQMAEMLAAKMEVSKHHAVTLVQTETAYVAGQGTAEGYKSAGLDEYQILATLDGRTSQVCRKQDGRRYRVSEIRVGSNYPPFHARCRTTTIPVIDETAGIGERRARDPVTGKVNLVPADMKYPDWYKQYVVDKHGQDKADLAQIQLRNQAADEKQHARYRGILGKEIPREFSKFQELKYTNIEGWNKAKGDYRKLNAYVKITANEPEITAHLNEIAKKAETELVGQEYRLKTKDSYLRKVNSDSNNSLDAKIIGHTITNTNDVIRYTYQTSGDKLTDSYFRIQSELESKGYSIHKLKNTWEDKRNPYKGINAIFTSPAGQRFEVQFHTPQSFDLKNGPLHKLYEEYRLDSTSPARRVELTKEMFRMSADLEKPRNIDKIK